MRVAIGALMLALVLSVNAACGGGAAATPSPTVPPTEPPPSPTVEPTEPPLVLRDIKPSRLVIPSLGIDSSIQTSQTVPDTSTPPAGCPTREPGQDTLTVPSQGIATPAETIDGLQNKAWIFGHSRFSGVPGVFLSLQDINIGDELFIDGVVRETGEQVLHQRFVVNSIYLTDTDSGQKLIAAETAADIPRQPVVVLQTSVREDGPGKQWILNQQKVLAKAKTVVDGDLSDPCKYLLLFVFATPA